MKMNLNYDGIEHFNRLAAIHHRGVVCAKENREYIASITALTKGSNAMFDIYIDGSEDIVDGADWFGELAVDVFQMVDRASKQELDRWSNKLYTKLLFEGVSSAVRNVLTCLDVFFDVLGGLEEQGFLWFVSDLKYPVYHVKDKDKICRIRIHKNHYADWDTNSLFIAYNPNLIEALIKVGGSHAVA